MTRIITFLFILSLMSCNHQKADTKSEGEKLMQISREWSAIAATGDIEKTLSYWADDAVVMPAGQPTVKGKAAIRKMVEESMKIPGFRISWEPQSVEVSESGDMAYMLENSNVSFNDSTGKQMTFHNKTVTVWRKQADGAWKNVVDISTPEPVMNNFGRIDDKLNQFAKNLGAKIQKEGSGYAVNGVPVPPAYTEDRRIVWTDGSIGKAIIIQPDFGFDTKNFSSPKWNFYNVAWLEHDPSGRQERPSCQYYLLKKVEFKEIEKDIDQLLRAAADSLHKISREDLKSSATGYQFLSDIPEKKPDGIVSKKF
jgi:uncharacterized protein (TIGR02246 family)